MPLEQGTRFGPYEIVAPIGRRRHGRGVQGSRHQARPDRRVEDSSASTLRRDKISAYVSNGRRAQSHRSIIRTSARYSTSASRTVLSSW